MPANPSLPRSQALITRYNGMEACSDHNVPLIWNAGHTCAIAACDGATDWRRAGLPATGERPDSNACASRDGDAEVALPETLLLSDDGTPAGRFDKRAVHRHIGDCVVDRDRQMQKHARRNVPASVFASMGGAIRIPVRAVLNRPTEPVR